MIIRSTPSLLSISIRKITNDVNTFICETVVRYTFYQSPFSSPAPLSSSPFPSNVHLQLFIVHLYLFDLASYHVTAFPPSSRDRGTAIQKINPLKRRK